MSTRNCRNTRGLEVAADVTVAEEGMAVVDSEVAAVAVIAIVAHSGVMPRVDVETISAEMVTIADRSLPAGMTTGVVLEPRVEAVWTADSNQAVVDSDRAAVVTVVDSDREEPADAMDSEVTNWEDSAVATAPAAFARKMVQALGDTVQATPHSRKIDALQAFHRRLPLANLRRRLEVHHHLVSALRHRHEVPSYDQDLHLRALSEARSDPSTEVQATEQEVQAVSPVALAPVSSLLDRIEHIYKIIEYSI